MRRQPGEVQQADVGRMLVLLVLSAALLGVSLAVHYACQIFGNFQPALTGPILRAVGLLLCALPIFVLLPGPTRLVRVICASVPALATAFALAASRTCHTAFPVSLAANIAVAAVAAASLFVLGLPVQRASLGMSVRMHGVCAVSLLVVGLLAPLLGFGWFWADY